MFNLLLKTSSCHRPQQIAGAVCLGLACGLLPKDTLLFPLGLLVLYCAPIHLLLSVSLVTLVSLLGLVVRPLQGTVGNWLLAQQSMQGLVGMIESYPMMAWLRLHNSVVLGSLPTSLIAAVPTYLLVRRWLSHLGGQEQLRPGQLQTSENLRAQPVRLSLVLPASDDPLAAEQTAPQESACHLAQGGERLRLYRIDPPLPAQLATPHTPRGSSDTTGCQPADQPDSQQLSSPAIDSIEALDDLLARVAADRSLRLDTDAVLARASRAADLVDEILNALESQSASDEAFHVLPPGNSPHLSARIGAMGGAMGNAPANDSAAEEHPPLAAPSQDMAQAQAADPSPPVADSRRETPTVRTFHSHETTISLRRATRPQFDSSAATTTEQAMTSVRDATIGLAGTRVGTSSAMTPTGLLPSQLAQADADSSAPQSPIKEAPHQESLLHLLNHLRTLRDKV